MRGAGAFLVLALLLAAPGQAGAGPRKLALELWVNGANTGQTVAADAEAGVLSLPRAILIANGIVFASDAKGEFVMLDGREGVTATVDESAQRLLVTADKAHMAATTFDLRSPYDLAPDRAATGVAFDYDFSAEAADISAPVRSGSAGLNGAFSFFTPSGVLRATGFARLRDGGGRGARLDTTFLSDDPEHLRRWSLGDAIGGSLPWSRAVRFAGLQLATDYALRPDLVTMPLPQFLGDTTVPASVDVFVGATRVFETDVQPGPFALHNLPIVTGGSEATIVVRDLLGRESVQTISLYTSNRLLAEGLSEYSLEAGVLRRDYGVKSFAYGAPVAAATWRGGMSDMLTLQAHGEFAQDVQMAGGGAVVALQPYATLGADVAVSTHKGQAGGLASVTAEGRFDVFSFFASWQAASDGFADLGSLEGMAIQRRRIQIGASASAGSYGSASFSAIDLRGAGDDRSRLFTGSYSLDFGDGRFLSLTGLYDARNETWSAGFYLNVSLSQRDFVSAAGNLDRSSGASGELSYVHEADFDGGFGYRASAATGATDKLEAEGVWYGSQLAANAGISATRESTGVRAGVNGSLVEMEGAVFAARQTDNAFALVRTGAPGVHVYRENRDVAVADANGEALVTGLAPFAGNRITIDPDEYPITTLVPVSERIVVPPRYSGVVVNLAPARHAPALLTLKLAGGAFPPPGSPGTLSGSTQDLIVGRNGKLFIEDLSAAATGVIRLPDGSCTFSVPAPPASPSRIPEIGPLLCERHGKDA